MNNICDCCANKSEEDIIKELVEIKSMEELQMAQNQLTQLEKHILQLSDLIKTISDNDLDLMEHGARMNRIEIPFIFTSKGRDDAIKYYDESLHKAQKGIRCTTEAINIKLIESNTTQ